MCSVSNTGDYWKDQIPYNPTPQIGMPYWDAQSFALLTQILELSKKLDEKMNQRDCENDEKMAYFKKIAEQLGVKLNLDLETPPKTTGLTFGEALEVLKADREAKVARSGWNGKGMYIYIQKDMDANWNDCIVMKTADNKMQPGWLASQTDMLSNDWMIV